MIQKKIILGTRKSKLALAQTQEVIEALKNHYPEIETQIEKIITLGDKEKNANLTRVQTIGVFTKEIEKALLEKKIDIAVHSLKDLPTKLSEGLMVACVLPRILPADVLVSRKYTLENLPSGAILGTSSPRRKVQLKRHRKDLQFKDIRGNLPTRLKKISTEKLDGIIVAAAGLIRLGYIKKFTVNSLQFTGNSFTVHSSRFTVSTLPYNICLPAAGQGTIGLEIRASDFELLKLLQPLNHLPTWHCITAERSFMRNISAGCNVPAGVLAQIKQKNKKRVTCHLEGFLFNETKNQIIKDMVSGTIDQAEKLGELLAQKILSKKRQQTTDLRL